MAVEHEAASKATKTSLELPSFMDLLGDLHHEILQRHYFLVHHSLLLHQLYLDKVLGLVLQNLGDRSY